MKKADFNKGVQEVLEGLEIKVNQTKAGEISSALFELVFNLVVEGEEVPVGTLGKITSVERGERKARNPQDPTVEIIVPAHKAPKFKPSKALKDTLKGK